MTPQPDSTVAELERDAEAVAFQGWPSHDGEGSSTAASASHLPARTEAARGRQGRRQGAGR